MANDSITVTDTMPDPVEYQGVPVQSAPVGGELDPPPLPTSVSSGVVRPQSAQNPAFTPAPPQASGLGKVVKSWFTGKENNYDYDSQGNLIQTQTPMKPGSLFRHIVAGALLGGAMGSQDPRHTFSGGFAAGSAGVLQDEERRDALRRKQAQEVADQRLKTQHSLREEQKLGLEREKLDLEKRAQDNQDMLAKGQTAHLYSEVLRNNALSAGTDLETHVKTRDFFAPTVNMFKSLGIIPEFEVAESQATEFMKQRWDKMGLTPVVVDMKPGVDKEGHATHEYVYGLYDLDSKKEYSIPGPVKEMWKSIGFDKTHPEYFAPNTKISANGLKAAQQQALSVFNDQMEQKKGLFSLDHVRAQTEEARARAKYYLTERVKANSELKKDEKLQQAMKQFKERGSVDKMDAELQPYLMNLANQELANKNALYKAAIADAEKEEAMMTPTATAAAAQSRARANAIAREMDDLDKMTDVFAPKPLTSDEVSKLPKPTGKDTSVRSVEAQQVFPLYDKAFRGDAAKIREAMLSNGWTLPTAAAPAAPEKSFVDKALPYVQDWLGGREKYGKSK